MKISLHSNGYDLCQQCYQTMNASSKIPLPSGHKFDETSNNLDSLYKMFPLVQKEIIHAMFIHDCNCNMPNAINTLLLLTQEPFADQTMLVFEQLYNIPLEKCTLNYKHCPSIIRLLTALKYHSLLLNIKIDSVYKDVFSKLMHNFCKPQLFDDFHHFIKNHQNQLEEIKSYALNSGNFTDCKLNFCDCASRHFGEETAAKKDIDSELNVYIETLDSLHVFIFHLYDMAMRTSQRDDILNDAFEVKNQGTRHFDRDFARIQRQMKHARKTTKQFSRFNNNSSQFKCASPNRQLKQMNPEEAAETYLDFIFQNLLSDNNIDNRCIEKLKEYMKNEDYDTDALDFDVQINYGNGNISKCIQNQNCIAVIIETFKKSRRMSPNSFIYFYKVFISTTVFAKKLSLLWLFQHWS